MIVNGKEYPLWSQFVMRKEEFVGGMLQEEDETTEIIDISLEPNGKDSAFFSVDGRDFGCGFDVRCGGIIMGEPNWITFCGYGGHTWRIRRGKQHRDEDDDI